MSRQVPRNIDRPNRNAEYAATFMVTWYGTMFMFHNPLLSLILTFMTFYLTYKLTLNKPEGAIYRIVYKRFGLGKMVPPPKKSRKFEI